jgi:hypothetical protein
MTKQTSQPPFTAGIDTASMRLIDGHSIVVNGNKRDVILMESDTHIAVIMISAKKMDSGVVKASDKTSTEDGHVA